MGTLTYKQAKDAFNSFLPKRIEVNTPPEGAILDGTDGKYSYLYQSAWLIHALMLAYEGSHSRFYLDVASNLVHKYCKQAYLKLSPPNWPVREQHYTWISKLDGYALALAELQFTQEALQLYLEYPRNHAYKLEHYDYDMPILIDIFNKYHKFWPIQDSGCARDRTTHWSKCCVHLIKAGFDEYKNTLSEEIKILLNDYILKNDTVSYNYVLKYPTKWVSDAQHANREPEFWYWLKKSAPSFYPKNIDPLKLLYNTFKTTIDNNEHRFNEPLDGSIGWPGHYIGIFFGWFYCMPDAYRMELINFLWEREPKINNNWQGDGPICLAGWAMQTLRNYN